MPDLYTVSFTTQKMVKQLDKRGNVVAEVKLDTPITLTALPHRTAMQYANCDNFTINRHEPDQSRDAARHGWGGAATKKVARTVAAAPSETRKTTTPAETGKQRAARTGDLAAAVNAA